MDLKDAGIYDLINIFTGQATERHKKGYLVEEGRNRTINIPAYQRPYRWDKEHIENLLNDYDENYNSESEENKKEYFIGSAVMVQKDDSTVDLIDGQQRITTLFLINFLRVLLYKEYLSNEASKGNLAVNSETSINNLIEMYANIVSNDKEKIKTIEKAKESMSNASKDFKDFQELKDTVSGIFFKKIYDPSTKDTIEDTVAFKKDQATKFFGNNSLSLRYTRTYYNEILEEVIKSTYISYNNDSNNIDIQNSMSECNVIAQTYIEAIKTIFNWVMNHIDCTNISNWGERCEKAAKLLTEIVNNMSICVVLTGSEDDAYKLFEVLNDRALEIDDLDLIKNHFYKEYCTKSNDTDEEKNKNILYIDELWNDEIFKQGEKNKNKLITFFGTTYLTQNHNITYSNTEKYKKVINDDYSTIIYTKVANPYNYNQLLSDINIFRAIRIILDKADYAINKKNEKCLISENSQETSICCKTINLLNALNQPGVIAALINVIIKTYEQENNLSAVNFKDSFSKYIDKIFDVQNKDYENVQKVSYELRRLSIMSKDYAIPKQFADDIVQNCGKKGNKISFSPSHEMVSNASSSFDNWTNSWEFTNETGKFKLKILYLNLLKSKREFENGKYKITIKPDLANFYSLDPSKIELDHLEPAEIDQTNQTRYFSYTEIETRKKIVNGSIGNFMILDKVYNIQGSNKPLEEAMKEYDTLKDSWLIQDINNMIGDKSYFDDVNDYKVPNKYFFEARSTKVKEYFNQYLSANYNDKIFIIDDDPIADLARS